MSNQHLFGAFEPNAILRGAQLTFVGANRSLQNPSLFTSDHYRQAALAVALGIAIRILVAIPTTGTRVLIRFIGLFADLQGSTWDEEVIDAIEFVEHSVLQVPFFLMSFLRYLSPTMDGMFMESLDWVDKTYYSKHAGEDPSELRAMYYPNLKAFENFEEVKTKEKRDPWEAGWAFLKRFGKKAGLSLGIYVASFLPYVGRFVLPAASFWTFNEKVGLPAAVVIFGSSVFLPKKYLVMFLQSYFSSRSLMRELLEPYFSRTHPTPQQKRRWFHDREGVLYGFALAFFVLLKVPLLGVLIYGIAEASTAYLITKITTPPPPPGQAAEEWKEKDTRWENKHEFLDLPLDKMDKLNVKTRGKEEKPTESSGIATGRQFS